MVAVRVEKSLNSIVTCCYRRLVTATAATTTVSATTAAAVTTAASTTTAAVATTAFFTRTSFIHGQGAPLEISTIRSFDSSFATIDHFDKSKPTRTPAAWRAFCLQCSKIPRRMRPSRKRDFFACVRTTADWWIRR